MCVCVCNDHIYTPAHSPTSPSTTKFTLNITQSVDIQRFVREESAKRVERQQAWERHTAEVTAKVAEEVRAHGDVVILPDLLDSYRTLPKKLMGFMWWSSLLHFNYTLKTDDDCFLNIDE